MNLDAALLELEGLTIGADLSSIVAEHDDVELASEQLLMCSKATAYRLESIQLLGHRIELHKRRVEALAMAPSS